MVFSTASIRICSNNLVKKGTLGLILCFFQLILWSFTIPVSSAMTFYKQGYGKLVHIHNWYVNKSRTGWYMRNSDTNNSGDFWKQKDVEVRVCCGVCAVKFQKLLASEAKIFFQEPGIEDSHLLMSIQEVGIP